MPAFSYSAIADSGKRQTGVLEADSAKHARILLREMGLFPDSVRPVAASSTSSTASTSPASRQTAGQRKKITNSDLANLTQQFSTLLSAGLSIEKSLSILIEQAPRKAMREVLADVRAGINEGETLAGALERRGQIFNPLYCALIEAGEMSGELPTVMERLARYSENAEALRQKTLLALLYPAMVTLVAILVIGGLLTYVVPQVIEVFQQNRQTLPLLTRMLVALSGFIRSYGWIFLVALLGAHFIFLWLMRKENLALRAHHTLLKLPGLGYLLRGIDSARLAHTLSILIGSGVPMMAALKAGVAVLGNRCLRAALVEASLRVREGMSLARALGKSGLFPPMLIHLVASGEACGQLGAMFERAATQQEREIQNRVALLTGILEPLLILVMGSIVLLIVLAILLPIIDLNQLLVSTR